ncbi:MAG: hypothetical protein ABI791_10720 [Acidobacteriota bacterium]
MRLNLSAVGLVFLLSSAVSAQQLSRQEKIQQIDTLNAQIAALENDILMPDTSDARQAKSEGFEIFRLMPREKYDHKLTVQGGGAYFSFTTGSHDYKKNAQIKLEQNFLSVGFAGADYGFMKDLGNRSLADVTKETAEISFLMNYRPPNIMADIRREQRKSDNYETDTATYSSRVIAAIDHVYALRSISFDRSDVLVVFKVFRKDVDGSLVIFWKWLETFDKPEYLVERGPDNN